MEVGHELSLISERFNYRFVSAESYLSVRRRNQVSSAWV